MRQRAQLTLEGLADASGVSARTIGGLERGHSLGPQRRTVAALADGLGVDEAERAALERPAEIGRPRPVTAPTGSSVPDAEELLDELHELELLSQTDSLRYGFHDLTRLFVRDRLAAEEEPSQRAALTETMTDWLLDVAAAAARWFKPCDDAAPPDWGQPVDSDLSHFISAVHEGE